MRKMGRTMSFWRESARAYTCEERMSYVELPSNLALLFGCEFDIQTGKVLLVSHVVVVHLRRIPRRT
jgi:hypothetical protein